jgi:hypothetical protein
MIDGRLDAIRAASHGMTSSTRVVPASWYRAFDRAMNRLAVPIRPTKIRRLGVDAPASPPV